MKFYGMVEHNLGTCRLSDRELDVRRSKLFILRNEKIYSKL